MRIGTVAAIATLLLTGCGTAAAHAGGTPEGSKAAGAAVDPTHWGMNVIPGQGTESPAPSPADAKRMTCAQVNTSKNVEYARISGHAADLPADNPVARDQTIVQPGNVALGHFAIGVDDGSGSLCAVAWVLASPRPTVGDPVALIVQIVRSTGGGYWLGPVNLPY